MLKIDILSKSSQNNVSVLKGDFWGFLMSKWRPDNLLAKAMSATAGFVLNTGSGRLSPSQGPSLTFGKANTWWIFNFGVNNQIYFLANYLLGHGWLQKQRHMSFVLLMLLWYLFLFPSIVYVPNLIHSMYCQQTKTNCLVRQRSETYFQLLQVPPRP